MKKGIPSFTNLDRGKVGFCRKASRFFGLFLRDQAVALNGEILQITELSAPSR